jgi:hypothetical protein
LGRGEWEAKEVGCEVMHTILEFRTRLVGKMAFRPFKAPAHYNLLKRVKMARPTYQKSRVNQQIHRELDDQHEHIPIGLIV